jgi:hypothetical protein
MSNGRAGDGGGRDQAWPGLVRWEFGAASGQVSDVVWQCDALLGGRLYHRSLFGSREEAEQFALRMRKVEPDQMFNVEAIKASQIWN